MKHQRIVSCLLATTLGCAAVLADTAAAPAKKNAPAKPAYATFGSVERLDPLLDQLIPADAQIEKLAEGFTWTEGPLWIAGGQYLLFSDVPRNTVYRWKDGEGVTEYLKPSGYSGSTGRGGEPGSNGLTVDRAGRLLLCQHGDRRVARLEANGSLTPLVEHYRGRAFNSPNDVVVKSNGDVYFTDPPYGLEGNNADPKKELLYNGVYRRSRAGEVTLIVRDLTFPNGLAFSPNEKTFYVAVSDPNRAVWMAYDVQDDGTVARGRVFFDSTPTVKTKPGLPDGMKVDQAGNVFATGPGGVLIFSPDGKHLGTIDTGVPTANCARTFAR